jgi:hypothetical protein
MSSLEGPPDQIDEGLRYVREQVLPLMQQQDGFRGFIAPSLSQKEIPMTLPLWRWLKAMQASEEVGDRTRSESAEAVSGALVGVERYKVGLFEVSSKLQVCSVDPGRVHLTLETQPLDPHPRGSRAFASSACVRMSSASMAASSCARLSRSSRPE